MERKAGKKAAGAFLQRQQDTPNLRKLMYGNGELTHTRQCTSFNINFQLKLIANKASQGSFSVLDTCRIDFCCVLFIVKQFSIKTRRNHL